MNDSEATGGVVTTMPGTTVHTGFGEQDGSRSSFLNRPVIKFTWDGDDTSWRYAYLRDLTVNEEA